MRSDGMRPSVFIVPDTAERASVDLVRLADSHEPTFNWQWRLNLAEGRSLREKDENPGGVRLSGQRTGATCGGRGA